MLPLAPLLGLIPSILSSIGKIVGGDKGKKIEEVVGTIDEVSEQLNTGRLPSDQDVALRSAIM